MIFQDHNLVPRLSVLKNVLTGRIASMPQLAAALQLFPRVDVEIALRALERVALADRAADRADRLSGGQQQRVGIARALAQQPQVILADEPVASLDPKTARVVLDDLRRAAHELGIAVLCNLHQVEYALEFADRIVGICAGHVVFEGTPAQIDDSLCAHLSRSDWRGRYVLNSGARGTSMDGILSWQICLLARRTVEYQTAIPLVREWSQLGVLVWSARAIN
jgi:phosphonate transport system ATP-binding protein